MIEELNKNFENFKSQYIPKLDDEAKRIEAFKDFKKLGFPNKKLEDWKFSDFNSIISNKIQTIKVSLERNEKFKFENFIKDFDHLKIFFFNGFFKVGVGVRGGCVLKFCCLLNGFVNACESSHGLMDVGGVDG